MKGLSINPDVDINELRSEYRSLKWRAKEKIDSWKSLMWIVHPTLTLAVTAFVAFRTFNLGDTFLAAFAYGYIPGMFASMIVTGLLNFVIGKRFGHYLENRRLTSSWYQRYQYLRTYIPEYEEAENLRLAEEKRIRLQPVRDEVKRISGEVQKIEEVVKASENIIWKKRKWYPEYREYQDAIEECIPKLEELEGQGQLARARFGLLAEEASYEFYRLFNYISNLRDRCQSVLSKMKGMKDWTPPVQTRITPKRDTTIPAPQPSGTRTTNQTSPIPTFVPDNTGENAVKQPVVVPPPEPPKRRELDGELKKIPFEDYVGAAKAKMTIGELGEVIVLHYEVRRVEAETGAPALGKVTRVSEQTDSLGYDIESFSQGDKVFIEVKSTSGSFWTDFFLSENERRVMNKLGEKYWLYRIFALSKKDSSAKLSIFRGKAEIDASFELEPVNFRMNPKTNVSGQGTLPFETLED